MTKKALISTAELKRLASIAKSAGVTVEVEVDGIIVRIKPSTCEIGSKSSELPDDFAL